MPSQSPDTAHIREYEYARGIALDQGIPLPEWDDLQEFQRESIREENIRYWKEMDDFGKGLAALGEIS